MLQTEYVWNQWTTTYDPVWFLGRKNNRIFYYIILNILTIWKYNEKLLTKRRVFFVFFIETVALCIERSSTSIVAMLLMQPVYYVSTLTLKNKVPCIITIIGGFINIFAMYVLLKYTNIGAIAVVITTSVIMICINLFFNPIYSAKCLQINPKFFYNIIIKHILANVFLIIVFSFIAKLLMPETWIGIIGVGLIMVVIGVPIYMLITYRIEEIKEKYKLIIKRNKEK